MKRVFAVVILCGMAAFIILFACSGLQSNKAESDSAGMPEDRKTEQKKSDFSESDIAQMNQENDIIEDEKDTVIIVESTPQAPEIQTWESIPTPQKDCV